MKRACWLVFAVAMALGVGGCDRTLGAACARDSDCETAFCSREGHCAIFVPDGGGGEGEAHVDAHLIDAHLVDAHLRDAYTPDAYTPDAYVPDAMPDASPLLTE